MLTQSSGYLPDIYTGIGNGSWYTFTTHKHTLVRQLDSTRPHTHTRGTPHSHLVADMNHANTNVMTAHNYMYIIPSHVSTLSDQLRF